MIITGIEDGYRKLKRIYIDEEYKFSLYEKEIYIYQLKLGKEITHEVYLQIMEDTIYKRGKRKALNLLKRMDYTEGELRSKLKKSEFTQDMIDRVIAYIHSYHYLDDERYANRYIVNKTSNKSIRQIKMELLNKGIDKELIEEQLEKNCTSDEAAIQQAISKKTKDITALTLKEKQKIAAYLYRKGFQQSDIRHHLW